MKVFVMSLHRCGTSSAHEFISAFGFSSVHCPRWAKDGKDREIGLTTTDPRTVLDLIKPVLALYQAASDVPIPCLSSVLPAAYPGSKYIWITRDPGGWIKSVRRHCGGRALEPYERMIYHVASVDDLSDLDLAQIHARHAKTLASDLEGEDLFTGKLGDRQLGPKLAAFLGQAPWPFPHVNAW